MKPSPPSHWYKTGETRIAPWYFGIMRAEVQMRRDHYDLDGLNSGFNTKWVGAGRLPDNLANESYYSMLATTEDINPFTFFWRCLVTALPKLKGDPVPEPPANRGARYRQYMRERDDRQRERDERILKGYEDSE